MAQVQIKNVSVKHEAIMDWLLVHPASSHRDCAQAFQVSESWLSIIIHSQAFKVRMAEKQEATFEEIVIPLRDKMLGVSHVAFEKLGRMVEGSMDPDFILSVADKTAHRLGYAPSKGPDPAASTVVNQQNNFYTVDKSTLSHARERLREVQNEKVINAEPVALPASE